MTKLTKYMREQIVKDLLAHRFAKAAEKLVKDRAAFATKVYNDLYPPATRKKMEALPDGWLPTANSMSARFGTDYVGLQFNGEVYGEVYQVLPKPIEAVSRRVQAVHVRGCVRAYEVDHALAIAHGDLEARAKDLKGQISQARRSAEAAVDSVTTIRRLIEIWPEVDPFASKHAASKASLPALPTDDLNKLLDLPVAA